MKTKTAITIAAAPIGLTVILLIFALSLEKVTRWECCSICRQASKHVRWNSIVGTISETKTSHPNPCSDWVERQEPNTHPHNTVAGPDFYIWGPGYRAAGSSGNTSSFWLVEESDQLEIYQRCHDERSLQAGMAFFGKFKTHSYSDIDQRKLEFELHDRIKLLLTKESLTELDFVISDE